MSSPPPDPQSEHNKKWTSGCNPLQCRCGRHWFPQRFILAFMLHLCLQNNFNTRVVLNVAIVDMVAPEKEVNYTIACPQFVKPHHTEQGGKFPWPQETKALVLYAFYIGYTVTQIPGGWLADKFGARIVILGCVVVTTVSTAIFPLVTQSWGYLAAVGFRFILGMSHGPSMPAISSMVSTWFSIKERPRWGSLCYSGTNLGTILGNILTGLLIKTFKGWPVAFYFWSAYSGFYFFLVLMFLYSFPDTHPFINQEEVDYIKQSHSIHRVVTKRALKTPWKAILLNVPYWANIAAQFGHNYIYFVLITYLPTYMNEILRFNVDQDGYFSAAPFLALWLMSLFLSVVAQYFTKCISERTFVTVFGAGSNVASALLVLGAVYAGCNRVLCITLYILSMLVKAFYYVTLTVNINALSKNYGGILFGLCNTLGSLSGIIGNLLIGSLTKTKQLHEWQLVFWITLGIQLVTTIIFFIFCSVERQKFDYEEDELPTE